MDVVSEARSWIGTPFKHQGRTKGVGVDCIGLVYGVAESLGLTPDELPQEYIGYSRMPEQGRLREALDKYMDRISLSRAEPGDVLLMTFARDPQHVAITTGNTIIHAYSLVKKCTEHSLSPKWTRRICGAYRFRCPS